ncbi:MAG: hypothetical protein ACI9W6_000462 [Motiliproteus sp.]|jgi:hypothetical protein
MSTRDNDAQQVTSQRNMAQLNARVIDELVGLGKKITAGSSIDQSETQRLHQWELDNQQGADTLLASIIYKNIQQMLADEVLDNDEAEELLGMLSDLSDGGQGFGKGLQ